MIKRTFGSEKPIAENRERVILDFDCLRFSKLRCIASYSARNTRFDANNWQSHKAKDSGHPLCCPTKA